jgi:hypothetical protein
LHKSRLYISPTYIPVLGLVVLLYNFGSKSTAEILTTIATAAAMIAMTTVLKLLLLLAPSQLMQGSTLPRYNI